jgi:cytochrome P450
MRLWHTSANRDETVFDAPGRFDIGRKENPYLTFGGGPHICLGATLARLEIRRRAFPASVAVRKPLRVSCSRRPVSGSRPRDTLPYHPPRPS